MSFNPGRFNGACHTCGVIGHRAANCTTGQRVAIAPRTQYRARRRDVGVGAYAFECDCGNRFSGICEGMGGSARCYECNRMAQPSRRLGEDLRERKSNNAHSCNRCNGSGNCPIAGSRRRRS